MRRAGENGVSTGGVDPVLMLSAKASAVAGAKVTPNIEWPVE